MSQGYWAAANLILVITSSFYAAMPYIEGYRAADKSCDGKKRAFFRHMGVIFAAITAFTFLLTENVTQPMRLTDDWTVLMVLLTAAQIPGIVVRYSRNYEED